MAGTSLAAVSRPFSGSQDQDQRPIMATSSENASPNASGATSQNLNALGTLIGYIGAEAATVHLFERLLWPQRFWNRLTPRTAVLMALLMPMGGPLHKAALQTLDEFFDRGLFRGVRQGHMLGTAFFRDSQLGYTVWSCGEAVEQEFVRNGLWLRALAQMEMAEILPKEDKSTEAAMAPKRPLRAKTSLSHLVLESSTEMRPEDRPVIQNDTGPPSASVYAGVFISELTGVCMGTFVACIWKSWIAILWFMPVILKLISTFWSISREDLVHPSLSIADQKAEEPRKMFEIYDPHHGLFIIEGHESVVLQFFRHYGHPVRNRFREVLQFAIIICLGLVFPMGLVISVLWMPDGMQYLWFGYQLYTTLTMYVYRYANTHFWGTTEEAIGKELEMCRSKGQAECIDLRGRDGCIVMATLSTTYYNNLKDAQHAALVMLKSPKRDPTPALDSETTMVGDYRAEKEEKASEDG